MTWYFIVILFLSFWCNVYLLAKLVVARDEKKEANLHIKELMQRIYDLKKIISDGLI